jgi:hypothetical protein
MRIPVRSKSGLAKGSIKANPAMPTATRIGRWGLTGIFIVARIELKAC